MDPLTISEVGVCEKERNLSNEKWLTDSGFLDRFVSLKEIVSLYVLTTSLST